MSMVDRSLLDALISAAHALGSLESSLGQVEALLKQQDVNDFLAFGRMRAHFYKHATLRTNIRAVVQESEVVGDAYRACAYLRRIACDSSAPLQYLWKWTNSKQVKADRAGIYGVKRRLMSPLATPAARTTAVRMADVVRWRRLRPQ